MLLGTRSKILHQHSKQKAALVYREGPIIGEVWGSKNIREWTRCMLKTGASVWRGLEIAAGNRS